MMDNVEDKAPLLSADRVLAVLLGLGLAFGIVLDMPYSPSDPGTSMRSMRTDPAWRWLANAHYWTSFVLLLSAAIQVARLAWHGAYLDSKGRWLLTLGTALLAFGFQLTGNLLPYDAHDVQTVVIEAGIAAQMPLLGPMVGRAMLQGNEFSGATVTAWHVAHMWILGIAAAGVMAGLFRAAKRGGRLDLAFAIGAPLVLAFFLASPTGRPTNATDFNAYNATASWYVWPMHGALAAFQKLDPAYGWIGSGLLPGLFVGFLASLPWLGGRFSKPAIRLTLLGFVGLFGALAIGFGGSPAPIIGPQEPTVLAVANPAKPNEAATAEIVELGRKMFNRSGCAGCHGREGRGGLTAPRLADYWKTAPDAETIARFIANPRSVKPNSTMPAFVDVPPDARMLIAHYLRSKPATP